MSKVTLETLADGLETLAINMKNSFKAVDARFDIIDNKLEEQDDLLHLIADTVSRHDDDLTYLKRTLRHQRV